MSDQESIVSFLQATNPELATALTMERLELGKLIARFQAALTLPLLFYSAPWNAENREQWLAITGEPEATTKIMCDHIRGVLNIGAWGDS